MRGGWSDSVVIGTSVADTTSNGGRALDFPAAPIAAGNSCLIETACRTTQPEPITSPLLDVRISYSRACRSVPSTRGHTADETSEGW